MIFGRVAILAGRASPAVANPSRAVNPWLTTALAAWQPADQAFQPPRLAWFAPLAPAATPPILGRNPWFHNALWQPPDPQPQRPRALPAQYTAVRVDFPPTTYPSWAPVITSWQPPDPLPQQHINLAPPLTAVRVDAPPVMTTPALSSTIPQIVWQPPDPMPQQHINLAPSFTAVRVDGAPVVYPSWAPVVASWQPPDPLPQQRRPTAIYVPNGVLRSPNAMTSATTPSPYVISASTNHTDPTYAEWHAFDGSVSTFWAAGDGNLPPSWIKVDLGATYYVATYTLTARSPTSFNPWTAWTLSGSSDNVNFFVVDSRTGQTFGNGEARTFTSAANMFRYWRFDISAIGGSGTYAEMAEIALYS